MTLYIRDQSVDDLAIKVAKLGKAPNKTEAVRRALLNEISRLEQAEPLEQRVKKIQDEFKQLAGPTRTPFDMKAFRDLLYEDD